MAITVTSGTGGWGAAGSDALSEIVRERLVEYAERRVIIANLVTVDDTGSARGLIHRVDRWPDLSSNVNTALTEGTDMTPAAVLATATAITPAVTGMGAEISDLLASATPFAGLNPFLRQMAAVTAEELDDDLATLFTALSGGTAMGTSTADCTLSDFLDALVDIQTAQAPGPYAAVLHPRQAADLGLAVGGFTSADFDPATGSTDYGNISAAGAAGTQTTAFIDRLGIPSANGYVGSLCGVPVYVSARCPLVNTSADRSGAVFARDAMTVARKWGIRTEMDRNIYGPNTRLAVTTAYGVAETADQFGCAIETDA